MQMRNENYPLLCWTFCLLLFLLLLPHLSSQPTRRRACRLRQNSRAWCLQISFILIYLRRKGPNNLNLGIASLRVGSLLEHNNGSFNTLNGPSHCLLFALSFQKAEILDFRIENISFICLVLSSNRLGMESISTTSSMAISLTLIWKKALQICSKKFIIMEWKQTREETNIVNRQNLVARHHNIAATLQLRLFTKAGNEHSGKLINP